MYSNGLSADKKIEYFIFTKTGKKLLESLGYNEVVNIHNETGECFNSSEINRLETDIKLGLYDKKLKEIINSIKSI